MLHDEGSMNGRTKADAVDTTKHPRSHARSVREIGRKRVQKYKSNTQIGREGAVCCNKPAVQQLAVTGAVST